MPTKLLGSFKDACGMSGSVLERTVSYFGCLKLIRKIPKISTFFMLDDVFRLFSCSVVATQETVFQRNARILEQDPCTEKEKALRVPRAVNIG